MRLRHRVTLFGRAGCSPCREAELLLERLARELGFQFEAVDIDGDDALQRRYLFEIPVVLFDGEELARAPITAKVLEAEVRERLSPPGGRRR